MNERTKFLFQGLFYTHTHTQTAILFSSKKVFRWSLTESVPDKFFLRDDAMVQKTIFGGGQRSRRTLAAGAAQEKRRRSSSKTSFGRYS